MDSNDGVGRVCHNSHIASPEGGRRNCSVCWVRAIPPHLLFKKLSIFIVIACCHMATDFLSLSNVESEMRILILSATVKALEVECIGMLMWAYSHDEDYREVYPNWFNDLYRII